jgi:hypothetical protein
MTIEKWLFDFAFAHWIRNDYNIVMLSALYSEPSNLMNMLKIFSSQIWIFIINSIALISTLVFVNNQINGKCFVNRIQKKFNQ